MANDEYTKNYLRHLLDAAVAHTVSLPDKPVTTFYRNKNEDYWRRVDSNRNVMMPFDKDNGGDRRSPINGRLEGVFLDITLRNGELPVKSPFGSTRVVFPIKGLYDDTTNLFFTDFYCKTQSFRNHFVTLVLSKKGSFADQFCKQKLVQLNPETNSFFKRRIRFDQVPSYTSIANPPMHVEVFYTESVDLNHLEQRFGTSAVRRYHTDTFGRGSSTWGGIPKNTQCGICNPCSTDRLKEPMGIEILQNDATEENIPQIGHSTDDDDMTNVTSDDDTMTSEEDLSQKIAFSAFSDGIIRESRSKEDNKDETDKDTNDKTMNLIERRITRSMTKEELLKEEVEKQRLNRRETRSMTRKHPITAHLPENELSGAGKRLKRV